MLCDNGGTHLHQKRYDLIEKVGKQALSALGVQIPVETYDNIVLHDSTANHIIANKLFDYGSTTLKQWAPFTEDALKYMETIHAKKTIVLMSGIRHARQLEKGEIDQGHYTKMLHEFISAARTSSPTATIMLMSVLYGQVNELRAPCRFINQKMQALSNIEDNIIYVDTETALPTKAMKGIHIKEQYTHILVTSIKKCLGTFQPSGPTYGRRTSPHPPRLFQNQQGSVARLRSQEQSPPTSHQSDNSHVISQVTSQSQPQSSTQRPLEVTARMAPTMMHPPQHVLQHNSSITTPGPVPNNVQSLPLRQNPGSVVHPEPGHNYQQDASQSQPRQSIERPLDVTASLAPTMSCPPPPTLQHYTSITPPDLNNAHTLPYQLSPPVSVAQSGPGHNYPPYISAPGIQSSPSTASVPLPPHQVAHYTPSYNDVMLSGIRHFATHPEPLHNVAPYAHQYSMPIYPNLPINYNWVNQSQIAY